MYPHTFVMYFLVFAGSGESNDFQAVDEIVRLPLGSNVRCPLVVMIDDSEPEPDEKFQLITSLAPEQEGPLTVQVEIFKNTSEIIILDDDRELCE